jgi:parvulin-like peptidyl-prolyl isomerase
VANPDAGPPVVLQVGSHGFTSAQLEALIQEQPEPLRAHYRSEAGRAAFIDQLVRTELLLQEARRRGLDQDPAVRAMVDRLLVQKLAEQLQPAPPDEGQLRAAYEAAQNEFVRPDRVHVRAIFWESPRGAADRASVEKSAKATVARLSGVKPAAREAAFEAAARTDTAYAPSREAGGDVGPRTPEDLSALFGAGIESPSAALQQPGQMTGLIETERGFVVLYLRGRQPGLSQTFEAVRPRLAQRLEAEARTKALEALVERLKKENGVQLPDGG